jgi:hypothetical protein
VLLVTTYKHSGRSRNSDLCSRYSHNYNNFLGLCENHDKSNFVNIVDFLKLDSVYLNNTSKLLQIINLKLAWGALLNRIT